MTERTGLLTLPGENADIPLNPIAPASQSAAASNTIEQVRELLYGEAMRHYGRRVEGVEETVRTLEQTLHHRLDDMLAAIEVLGRALRSEQAEATRSIGLAIMEIGRRITTMGESGDRATDRRHR